MMPTVVGITESMLTSGKKVILAGGTQMCCIAAILKNLKVSLKTNVCIGTTSYVHNDMSSDISNLASQVDKELPIYYIDLGLENSKKDGLRAYSQGFVKEGAGAGGMALAAFINNPALSTNEFLRKIENNYHDTIEIPRLLLTGKN
jgi:NaMN:DMB phosphoribosyltransferase